MFYVLWFFLIAYATWVHLYFGSFDVVIALGGWSAHDFTNSVLLPENFERDYSGGSYSSGNSSLPWIYPALTYIGVPVSVSSPILIALEMMVLTLGACYLMKTVFRDISSLALLALSVLLVMSNIRFGDLARFADPFFHGHFYGFADGVSFFAIAYYFNKKFKTSTALLSIGFTIHPIKTLSGFIFLSGCQLCKLRGTFTTRLYLPYLLFVLTALLWVYFFLGVGSGVILISSEDFFKYSPLFNSHWYPQDLNILTTMHPVYATAFLSCMLAGLSSLFRSDFCESRKVQIALGIVVLCIVSFVGLAVSWFELSPTLVKISLQRASSLALSLMTIVVIGQLFVDIRMGRWWFVALSSLLILAAFTPMRWTWPLLVSLIYALTAIYDKRETLRLSFFLPILIFFFIFAIAGYEIYLYIQGFQLDDYWITPIKLLGVIIIGLALYKVFIQKVFPSLDEKVKFFLPFMLTFLFVYQSYGWGIENRTLSRSYIELGLSYKEVQVWARDNTVYDALFMTDPTMAYGWRDFSQRSSFGTLQEWYKTGWIYSGYQEDLQEGLKRGALFGINELVPERFEKRPQWEFIEQAYSTILRNYYAPSGELLARIAHDYHIDYFVMDNSKAFANGAIPAWSIVFENKHYTVIRSPAYAQH
jgi:hypothetical protein